MMMLELKTPKYFVLVASWWMSPNQCNSHRHHLHDHHLLIPQPFHRPNLTFQNNKNMRLRHNFHRVSKREKKKFTLKNKSTAETDHCVAEYFKAKKPTIQRIESETRSHKIGKQEGLKMFLLGMLPEPMIDKWNILNGDFYHL